jgi:transcriptional regulator with XRE-family HTH domain
MTNSGGNFLGTLYETIRSLCDKKGIKPGKMCSDLGMSKSIMTKLQDDPTRTIKLDTARKIADYFSVTLEELDSGDLSESDAEKAPATEGEGIKYTDFELLQAYHDADFRTKEAIRTLLGIKGD